MFWKLNCKNVKFVEEYIANQIFSDDIVLFTENSKNDGDGNEQVERGKYKVKKVQWKDKSLTRVKRNSFTENNSIKIGDRQNLSL